MDSPTNLYHDVVRMTIICPECGAELEVDNPRANLTMICDACGAEIKIEQVAVNYSLIIEEK